MTIGENAVLAGLLNTMLGGSMLVLPVAAMTGGYLIWATSAVLLGLIQGYNAYLLVKQRDPFGAAVCLFWLGTACIGAGIYAADARAQAQLRRRPGAGGTPWRRLAMYRSVARARSKE